VSSSLGLAPFLSHDTIPFYSRLLSFSWYHRTVDASHEGVALAAAAAAAAAAVATELVEGGGTAPLAEPITFNIEELIQESELVMMKDRDLVPDALFVAIAQSKFRMLFTLLKMRHFRLFEASSLSFSVPFVVKRCNLTQADRVGCYKTRDINFLGMCCKFCGGQPGFGRYFPNSVRSLARKC